MWSFIMPAHNEALLLGATLSALRDAARDAGIAHEILVVDDASTDATAGIAEAAGARVLHVDHRQIAAARNAGAREARGDVLVFIDADTHINAPLLRATAAALQRGAVGGGATVRFIEPLPWHIRMATVASVLGLTAAGVIPGCYLFATRAAFDATGGFDATYFAAEDVLMSRALSRIGPMVILREHVHTSARKLSSHGSMAHLRLAWNFIRHGRDMLRSRQHLGLWYDGRGRGNPAADDAAKE